MDRGIRRARVLRWRRAGWYAAVVIGVASSGWRIARAQDPVPVDDSGSLDLPATWETQTEARTIVLNVPAPRGQITDRYGIALAQNKVGYYPAISFPFLENADDATVLAFAHAQIRRVNEVLGNAWTIPDDRILDHYRNRRWVPLLFRELLGDEELTRLEPFTGEGKGLVLQPCYVRHYPQGKFASHIVGYVGIERPMPTGEIGAGDPLFPEVEGRYALEKSFDDYLAGENGMVNNLFDSDGQKLQEFLVRVPKPGNNVITTIDASLQKFAEEALKNYTKRGAVVVVDVRHGDILALASWPLFDPNAFIPRIMEGDFQALQDDPDKPLYPRMTQGLYPPASTFKVVVALAALEAGAITEDSYFNCPSSMTIGDRVMRNWNKNSEGSMNVVRAIKRSCNTWFFQVGMKTGAEQFLSVARRLGLGDVSGIPLEEKAGVIPESVRYSGTVANLSIGQGALLVTPLQVARVMAAVADGQSLVQPRLVLQVQDLNNNVVRAFPPVRSNDLGLSAKALKIVREGMHAVVHDGDGTGKRASIKYAEVCGKTGTGEWGAKDEDRRVAWFAGFLPADEPRYAFAVIEEGDAGERLSGGGNAAPMVSEIFTRFYEDEGDKRFFEANKDEEEAEEGAEDEEAGAESSESGSVPRAIPVDEPPPQAQPVESQPTPEQVEDPETSEKRGVFQRLWRRIRGR